MTGCLGFDIGGANIKAASSEGLALNRPFPMWKEPETLGAQLEDFLSAFPGTPRIAVTMTGELADCFDSKQDGVNHIVKTCLATLGEQTVFYQNQGQFVTAKLAVDTWTQTAAANWHALATWVAGQVESGFLFDIGSTTTDIIPFQNGKAQSSGKSDLERLRNQELIYTGVGRSPISCILSSQTISSSLHVALAQEFFATMQDAYLVLGRTSPEPQNLATADGKPLTLSRSHQRIARLLCSDPSELMNEEVEQISWAAADVQNGQILAGLQNVLAQHPRVPKRLVVSGQGEWLARSIATLALGPNCEILTLRDLLIEAPLTGDTDAFVTLSECAPAFAVACLLESRHAH